jgi:Methyltransferase domain
MSRYPSVDPQPGSVSASGHDEAMALLADLPRLHRWGGKEQVGGLNRAIGERILTELERYEAPRVIETGAGASTLLFCCLEPAELTSIAPNAELEERIRSEAVSRKIDVKPLQYLCERSEVALPRLAADGARFDVALIDGSHNWPSVFVDFCYLNMMMASGATLFLDDTQLYSVSQLYLLLREQDEFEYVGLDGKLATFRKRSDHSFLPEWNWQPFIERNSPVDAS